MSVLAERFEARNGCCRRTTSAVNDKQGRSQAMPQVNRTSN